MRDFRNWLEKDAHVITDKLMKLNMNGKAKTTLSGYGMKLRAIELAEHLQVILFPTLYEKHIESDRYLHARVLNNVNAAALLLNSMLREVFVNRCLDEARHGCDQAHCANLADETTLNFLDQLPEIRAILDSDIEAAYTGDPAARNREEILLAYPSLEVITIHRLAHALHLLDVPLIPRILAKIAHQRTGIDIHPGATIGHHFFIDHGTGVVIGETCVIGNHVKLYQGVTLGAKSFELDEDGNPVKGIKRHPNIEDHVIIYSGATILGGDTVIGHHSVIGGNVWLTRSVAPYTTVYHNPQEITERVTSA